MNKPVFDLYQRGAEAFKARRYPEAREAFEQLLEMGSRFADVLNMLGVMAFERGDFQAAKIHFSEALEINPRYTEAGLNLAVTYNDLGQNDEASHTYEHLRKSSGAEEGQVDPYVKGKLANLHGELGEIYHGMGLYSDALQEYKMALKLSPEFPDIRTRLGMLYRDMGCHGDAISEFTQVRQSHPDYPLAALQLGITYFGEDKTREAMEQWRAVLEVEPGNAKALMYLRLAEQSAS